MFVCLEYISDVFVCRQLREWIAKHKGESTSSDEDFASSGCTQIKPFRYISLFYSQDIFCLQHFMSTTFHVCVICMSNETSQQSQLLQTRVCCRLAFSMISDQRTRYDSVCRDSELITLCLGEKSSLFSLLFSFLSSKPRKSQMMVEESPGSADTLSKQKQPKPSGQTAPSELLDVLEAKVGCSLCRDD